MTAAMIIGGTMTAATMAPSRGSSDNIAAGKRVYLAKCTRCHRPYDPSHYDDATWDTWMRKMKAKAHLSDAQYQQLQDYLQTLRPKNE